MGIFLFLLWLSISRILHRELIAQHVIAGIVSVLDGRRCRNGCDLSDALGTAGDLEKFILLDINRMNIRDPFRSK